MDQGHKEGQNVEPLILYRNWENYEVVNVISEKAGHGGGDRRLQDKIFLNPNADDPYRHSAGLRDGVMSIMIGIAARKSIQSGKPIKISDLTDVL